MGAAWRSASTATGCALRDLLRRIGRFPTIDATESERRRESSVSQGPQNKD